MKQYWFPKPSRPHALGEVGTAAADFVWSYDTGNIPNPESLRVLRDVLARILDGEDPNQVFPGRKPGQRATWRGRDWLVAVYIESRRRRYKADGERQPLARAKEDAIGAFLWEEAGLEDAESAISTAWSRRDRSIEHFSDEILERCLLHMELQEQT